MEKVKPKNIKVILKYADAVYIYEDKDELIARIAIKDAGYDVNRFE